MNIIKASEAKELFLKHKVFSHADEMYLECIFNEIKFTSKEGHNYLSYDITLLRQEVEPVFIAEFLRNCGYFCRQEDENLTIMW